MDIETLIQKSGGPLGHISLIDNVVGREWKFIDGDNLSITNSLSGAIFEVYDMFIRDGLLWINLNKEVLNGEECPTPFKVFRRVPVNLE